jgi:hypothetical protein
MEGPTAMGGSGHSDQGSTAGPEIRHGSVTNSDQGSGAAAVAFRLDRQGLRQNRKWRGAACPLLLTDPLIATGVNGSWRPVWCSTTTLTCSER